MPKHTTKTKSGVYEQIKKQAISIISEEKNNWGAGTAFITDKVSFNMRNLIRQCRKNYWGVFDNPKDTQTGRDKIWIPLTESVVEASVKNVDVDTKNLEFKPKKENRGKFSIFLREFVRNRLEEVNFGEKLNIAERQLAIDGTIIWKVIETKKDGKIIPDIKLVDLLNFYIDPTASSIEEAESVIERALMTPEEIKSMDGWLETEDVEGEENQARYDDQMSNVNNKVKLVEVFERWGIMPKYLLTGKEKDKKKQVMGHIVVSGIKDGRGKVHLIEEVDKKPYEECWWTRVPGRWYGRGQAEKLIMMQLYVNTIVNIRITRSYVSQLGLFKVRKGAGITPQKLSRLATNGAILVNNMQDIEQLVMQEASQASYNDENVAQTWAERVTQAFEIVTGETLPATTTATVGAIQSRSATSSFLLVKEGIGLFLTRLMKRQVLPIIKKTIKKGDIVRFSVDGRELEEINEQIADYLASKRTIDYGLDFETEKAKIFAELMKKGKEKYIKLNNDINFDDYDVEVYIGDEKIDKNILVTNLINMMRIAPQYAEQLAKQVLDIVGINVNLPPAPPQIQGTEQNAGQLLAPPNANAQMTEAVTI